jgi:hypothetical protein
MNSIDITVWGSDIRQPLRLGKEFPKGRQPLDFEAALVRLEARPLPERT